MIGSEPMQDAGAVQEIVHQGIDGNHVGTSFGPARLLAAEQQTGQRHRQDLVRYAMCSATIKGLVARQSS